MEHPLIGDLSNLKEEELQEKISELNNKLMSAYKMGNSHLIGQIQMALESYKSQLQSRRQQDKPEHDDKIDIS